MWLVIFSFFFFFFLLTFDTMTESVVIEETLICQSNYQYSRHFIISNPATNFEVTIGTAEAGILSCELDDHKLVATDIASHELVDQHLPQLWDSHVHGYDTVILCSRDPSRKEITYHLNDHNLLTVEGRGFNSVVQPFVIASCFFNLVTLSLVVVVVVCVPNCCCFPFFLGSERVRPAQNSVAAKPFSLAGHCLHIEPSHDSLTILSNPAPQCTQFLSRTPVLISDEHQSLTSLDTVYSVNASAVPESYIRATLTFGQLRSVVVTLHTEQCSSCHLRVRVQDGAIAFLPHNMSKFKISYQFQRFH